MKVVTASEMREIDRKTIEDIGIPSLVLMERAGMAVVKEIMRRFERPPTVVLAGGGNNGGDGFVVARNLHNMGWDVVVYLLSDEDRLSEDCRTQYRIAKNLGIRIEKNRPTTFGENTLFIDAIIGTGLNKPLREDIAEIVRMVNALGCPVVAVDIPTGVSSDTGQIMGEAIRASVTVTFGLPKLGHFLHPGAALRGELIVEDIGFPRDLLEKDTLKINLITKDTSSRLMPKRPPDAHKGTFGHLLIVGGSPGKTGAIRLSAKGALRSGVGLVTVGLGRGLGSLFMAGATEEMVLPLPDKEGYIRRDALSEILRFIEEKVTALALGPGIGREEETIRFLLSLIRESPVPTVVDADALYALSTLKESLYDYLKEVETPLVLTPHPGEMGRLLQVSPKEVNSRRIELAREFVEKSGKTLVLKGSPTVIFTPEGQGYINSSGNQGMATAGTGDVLTGIIGGLLAQGVKPEQAAVLGVYVHGIAGDKAARVLTDISLTASDLINYIPESIKELRR